MRENRVNPHDAENAGAEDHDYRGSKAFANAAGGSDGRIHKRAYRIGKAHDAQALHTGIYHCGIIGKQRQEPFPKQQEQATQNKACSKGIGQADKVAFSARSRFPAPQFCPIKLVQAV